MSTTFIGKFTAWPFGATTALCTWRFLKQGQASGLTQYIDRRCLVSVAKREKLVTQPAQALALIRYRLQYPILAIDSGFYLLASSFRSGRIPAC